jgi:cardiolipin synthase
MSAGFLSWRSVQAVIWLAVFFVVRASAATPKQLSLDRWRSLTSATSEPPRAFIKGNRIRFYFEAPTNMMTFSGEWHHLRVPTDTYKVSSALLRLDPILTKSPESLRGWREATVIAGGEWRRLTTNLLDVLAPQTPLHGVYYQAFLGDRVLYRDSQGTARTALLGERPQSVVIDHRFSLEETLDVMARRVGEHLAVTHPGVTLFVLMAPNASRFTQPVLVDRQQRQCVLLSPAALYDSTERGIGFSATAGGLRTFLLDGHVLALIKNPVSSAARLADLGVQTVLNFLRLPLPRGAGGPVQTQPTSTMDLVGWESWLDRYTGTRSVEGSIQPVIDGDRFFTQLAQGIESATNHIHFNVYIFDRDDVAVGVADQLKERSSQVQVRVVLDEMGCLAAGLVPPATAMPEDFVPPSSISSYLKEGSRVQVRPFLNPWFSADHCKVFIVDGVRAWLGGMNIGREYRYEWHDMMVELEGPIVGSLENDFRRQWAHSGPLGDLAYTAELFAPGKQKAVSQEGTNYCRIRLLPTKTAWKPFSGAVMSALRRAQGYIYVENPYLFDKHVLAALVKAHDRGVDVRVVLPRVNDLKAGGRSNLVTANYLFQHGVRVYFYPGMTHVKALLVDGWSCVGSANLNHLSMHLCQEQNVATSDPVFAARLKTELFDEDFSRSFELNETISVDWIDFMSDAILESF